MSKKLYVCPDGTLHKVSPLYVSVDDELHKVKKGYVVVDGVHRQFYPSISLVGTREPTLLCESCDIVCHLHDNVFALTSGIGTVDFSTGVSTAIATGTNLSTANMQVVRVDDITWTYDEVIYHHNESSGSIETGYFSSVTNVPDLSSGLSVSESRVTKKYFPISDNFGILSAYYSATSTVDKGTFVTVDGTSCASITGSWVNFSQKSMVSYIPEIGGFVSIYYGGSSTYYVRACYYPVDLSDMTSPTIGSGIYTAYLTSNPNRIIPTFSHCVVPIDKNHVMVSYQIYWTSGSSYNKVYVHVLELSEDRKTFSSISSVTYSCEGYSSSLLKYEDNYMLVYYDQSFGKSITPVLMDDSYTLSKSDTIFALSGYINYGSVADAGNDHALLWFTKCPKHVSGLNSTEMTIAQGNAYLL